jgi:RNA-directed DNA polymerase
MEAGSDNVSLVFNSMSWEKALQSVYVIQKRLFKAIYVRDLTLALKLQKVILKSSSARLVSIRYVTQLCQNRKIAGNDGVIALTFTERFTLNESLKIHYSSWKHGNFRKLSVMGKNGIISFLKLSNLSDRCWQYLVRLAIEPAHEALFHPTNFGFRINNSLHFPQSFIFSNLCLSSFGFQKRLLELDLESVFNALKAQSLLKKIVAPRSIKVCLSSLIRKGFDVRFLESSKADYGLSSLLANILLSGIEDIHTCIRFGARIIFFLKPLENELDVLAKLKIFLLEISFTETVYAKLVSPLQGIDFLDWHFKVNSLRECVVIPSELNYQRFLLRVKRIINNSNYGSEVKANKLFPIVKEWLFYHQFSSLKGYRFSLFFIRKRAFKVFSKESRQDFFSSKRLLDKCFYAFDLQNFSFSKPSPFSFGYGHLIFGSSFILINSNNLISLNEKGKIYFYCIHCGVNYFKLV